MVWDLDTYYLRSYYLSHNTFLKIQIQSSYNKDFFYSEKPKSKNLKPVLSYNNITIKLARKKDKKNKKKKFYEQRREHIRKQKKQALAINVSIIEAVLKKKLKVRCFNYDKKGHYTNNCIKALKN